jgi:hypothetical protein
VSIIFIIQLNAHKENNYFKKSQDLLFFIYFFGKSDYLNLFISRIKVITSKTVLKAITFFIYLR